MLQPFTWNATLRWPSTLRLACVIGIALLCSCPYSDYPSDPHRKVAYGASNKEQTCSACHKGPPRSDTVDQGACLQCHETIGKQLKTQRGHHGRVIRPGAGKPCAQCHHEHQGPRWPESLISWSEGEQQVFRPLHADATGFALDGQHAELTCQTCHDRRRSSERSSFAGQRADCASCHQERSPHGPMRESLLHCNKCHRTDEWKQLQAPMQFDHTRDTDYPLRGRHATAPCSGCHEPRRDSAARAPGTTGPLFVLPKERYADCRSCHQDQNPHGASFGPRVCKNCHAAERNWTPRPFRHREETGFALLGRHAALRCRSCHRQAAPDAPESACSSCHRAVSPHGTRFAQVGVCDSCHTATDWQDSIFDHGKHTGFALDNQHSATRLSRCSKCHRRVGLGQGSFEFLNVTPRPAAASPSAGSQAGVPPSARPVVACRVCHAHREQHQQSKIAAQRTRPCLQCHERAGSARLAKVLINASQESSPVAEQLQWFGHGPERSFRLLGGHSLTAVRTCQACHKDRASGFDKLPTTCSHCHAAKDVHQGSLGACNRCHDPSTGSWLRTPHLNHGAAFRLEGSHRTAACISCHPRETPARQYRGRPTICGDAECHKRHDTEHKGSRGVLCGSSGCHSPEHAGWRIPAFHVPSGGANAAHAGTATPQRGVLK